MYVNGKIVSSKKIRNVYYGLDLKEKESLVVERNPAEKFAIILGRLVKYKGHEIDKSLGKVALHDNSLKLYIIGGGNYERNWLISPIICT
ncbi:MAG: hypothetical protein IPP39_15570 [Chitinophagaceae bacterium]|nr:hypothetical protein [Chitinophagaceae bacterium]